MKTKEYMALHNLNTNEDLRLHFRDNLMKGKLPIAMYSCPKCEEILNDVFDINTHKCKGG